MINLVGQSLQNGKYCLDQELGRGSFGITYKATDSLLDRQVAIKMLDPFLGENSNLTDWIGQFQNEARRLAKCSHINIVRVIDFCCENGLPYIVMDYIQGQTLDQILQDDNPLSEITALEYVRQIGEALSVVHEQSLLHQDIKPKNLILRRDTQQVVLIDFGIAREFSPELLRNYTNLFSEGYAPIEQYMVGTPRTSATDVYGLAATLYTLLTTKIPTSAISRVHGCILESPREIRSELSERVSEAVMWGMALEPERRPSSVSEWLASLTEATASEGTGNRESAIGFLCSLFPIPFNSEKSEATNSIVEIDIVKTDTVTAAKIPRQSNTRSRKIAIKNALATGATIFGLGALLAVAVPNSLEQSARLTDVQSKNTQSKNTQLTDKSVSTTSESPPVVAEPPQPSSTAIVKPVADQKVPVNPVSSSSVESQEPSKPATQDASKELEDKKDEEIDAQNPIEAAPVRSPVRSDAVPQIFANTETPSTSQPIILKSQKTSSSSSAENKREPLIFSSSSSSQNTKRQPAILNNSENSQEQRQTELIKKGRLNKTKINRGRYRHSR
jgi:eukaryotic-like serine/threonine-protein kinase